MSIQQALSKLVKFADLSSDEMQSAMHEIMEGQTTSAQIGAFLVALEMKTPTITEITAAAQVMHQHAHKITVEHFPLVDIVGTGGDHSNSFNISTTSAFVVAAAGAVVAKHGNRSVSSCSGSADVLEKAGVDLNLTPTQVKQCLEKIGIGFLFAPNYHPATKYVAAPRKELGIRTFFNLLGPLTNPANAKYLVVGVFNLKWLFPTAQALSDLGCQRALVIHSEDGLDEISCAAPTNVAELLNTGEIKSYKISPEEFGLNPEPLECLRVSNASESLALLERVLHNEDTPAKTIILMNAGAAIYIAGLSDSIAQGITKAEEMITSGKALEKYQQLISLTQLLGQNNGGV